jgi:hypothetical protein
VTKADCQNPTEAVFGDTLPCMRQIGFVEVVEGAGADPSQRIGTRLGALCRVEIADYVSVGGAHNTVKPVGDDGKGLKENLGSRR